MRIGRAGLIAGMLALLASPLAAKDEFPNDVAAREKAVKLEPISPWNIDYAESRCRLARVFGTEEEMHPVFFEQASPATSFTLTVGGQELRPFHRAAPIELGMENDEPMQRLERVAKAELGQFGPALIIQGKRINDRPDAPDDDNVANSNRTQVSLHQIDLGEAASIDRLVLMRGKRVLSFETGNMKAPFEALNQCSRTLLQTWGVDPEQHERYTPIKWTNRKAIARRISSSYPSTALRKGESGIFRLRVIVEPDGTMSECHLNSATLVDSLQSPACREMKNAVFQPALDKDGKPMRSYYLTRIIYQAS